jgi:cytochrome c-type biogenesis protein
VALLADSAHLHPRYLPRVPALDALPLDSPFRALPVLFGAGLLTSLTPCVYPMIPITVGILGGVGASGRAWPARMAYTGTYVLGLALVYSVLGVAAGLSGTIFGSVSSNPWASFAMANLLLLSGLALVDVFPVSAPSRFLAWASRFGGQSLGGAFMMGATSGLVAAPCGAPAFAAVLTFVTSTGSAVWGFIYLFVFSLGMSAVLVVAGVSSAALAGLPRAGRWTLWIKKASGVLLIAMAEYYLYRMGTVA